MSPDIQGLVYRVFPADGLWKWEVLKFGIQVGSGAEPTCEAARSQALTFAVEVLDRPAA